jgi:hypothetical protein
MRKKLEKFSYSRFIDSDFVMCEMCRLLYYLGFEL